MTLPTKATIARLNYLHAILGITCSTCEHYNPEADQPGNRCHIMKGYSGPGWWCKKWRLKDVDVSEPPGRGDGHERK